MNRTIVNFAGEELHALADGALWWPAQSLLCVSDLHLCKSERMMRRWGVMLPPYETEDTLARLGAIIARCAPRRVLCLGDSFDDTRAAKALPSEAGERLRQLQAGRDWIWIEGNHDPGPLGLGGRSCAEIAIGPLTFRHIAEPTEHPEISGHFHPKARVNAKGRMISRPCFLVDSRRIILPAFGTYTGGLSWDDPVFQPLFGTGARAILTGRTPVELPLPRASGARTA